MADTPTRRDFECVRGDSFIKKIALNIVIDGEKQDYELQEGDALVFGLSKGFKHEANYKLILSKDITENLELTKAQTEELEYGTYNYDIEFTRGSDGKRKTLIQGSFEVTKESI